MQRKLTRPDLTEEDKVKIQAVCTYYGYKFKSDEEDQNKKKYIIISYDDIAYVQRNERGIFFVWRKTEYVQFVDELILFTEKLKKCDMLPASKKNFNTRVINGFCKLFNIQSDRMIVNK